MMAKIFHFKPWEVDEIDHDMVVNMLNLETAYVKKQNDEMNKGTKR